MNDDKFYNSVISALGFFVILCDIMLVPIAIYLFWRLSTYE